MDHLWWGPMGVVPRDGVPRGGSHKPESALRDTSAHCELPQLSLPPMLLPTPSTTRVEKPLGTTFFMRSPLQGQSGTWP